MTNDETPATASRDGASSVLDELETARNRLERVEARIEEYGQERVETAASAYENAAKLLDHYVDHATGTGRTAFQAYVKFEGQFAGLVERLPEGLSHREAFEDALDVLDKRELREGDFDRAERVLADASIYPELTEEREQAREALSDARSAARERVREIDETIEAHETVASYRGLDLDAPVERLREPIETYDEAIREAFERYRRDVSAREVFALIERSEWHPLVAFEPPPEDLKSYVETAPAGTNTVPQLLEYAEYSRSKLSHYVDEADALKRQVATQRTYLESIDGEALTVGWPPPPSDRLRWTIRDLEPLVRRVARNAPNPPASGGSGADEAGAGAVATDPVTALRSVREIARDPEYGRLRRTAEGREVLSTEERRLLVEGRVDDEIAALRDERERLETAIGE